MAKGEYEVLYAISFVPLSLLPWSGVGETRRQSRPLPLQREKNSTSWERRVSEKVKKLNCELNICVSDCILKNQSVIIK